MATRTSTQSGNWSATSTWGGSAAPGSGDLAIISNGHTVTIQGTDVITVGDGDATHLAISTAGTGGTGILVCQNGFSLTLTSSVLMGVATWTIGRGTIVYTNGTNGTWTVGDSFAGFATLNLTGQAGNHGSISSSGVGTLSFLAGNFGNGLGAIRYYDFTKIGDASTSMWGVSFFVGGTSLSFRDCNMNTCGAIKPQGSPPDGSTIIIEDTVWSNTPGDCLGPNMGVNAFTSGTRSIQGNYFDKTIGSNSDGGQWIGFTMRFNFIGGEMATLDSADVSPAVFGSNLFVMGAVLSDIPWQADTSPSDPNFLHINDLAGTITNAHGFGLSVRKDVTFSGWFIEPGDTDHDGDYIIGTDPGGSSRNHTVSYNVARPNKNGEHGGMFHSDLGAANYSAQINHNTYYSTGGGSGIETGSCAYGESYGGHADIYSEIKNNLVVSNTGSGYVFIRRDQRTVSDGCAAANIHNNGKYQLSSGNVGVNGYADNAINGTFAPMFSSTTSLGANDVIANPNFVDDTRGIATWAVARGYSTASTYNGRVADAYAAIAIDRTRIADLISWCMAGFAPTNVAFKGTASDSGDIGAQAVVLTGGITTTMIDGDLTTTVLTNSMTLGTDTLGIS